MGTGVPHSAGHHRRAAEARPDVRDELPQPILRTDVMEMKDLKPGMVLTGTVRNVIDFGAFVDIGVHQDGLVHISQISSKFIKHPSEVLTVGDVVKVVVLDVDEKKKSHQPEHQAGKGQGMILSALTEKGGEYQIFQYVTADRKKRRGGE